MSLRLASRLLVAAAVAAMLSADAVAGVNTWTTNGPTPATIRSLALDPTTPTTLFAGAEGAGIHRSLDGGDTWTDVTPGSTGTVLALAIDPVTPSTIFAGTDAGGIFRSDDGGDTWLLDGAGLTSLDVQALAIDPSNPAIMYAGTDGGGVNKSSNGGVTWGASSTGLVATVVNALAIDPSNTSVVYAGVNDGVAKSTDAGATWSNTGIAAPVLAVAVDPSDSNIVYAGTLFQGAYKSTDGGGTWTQMNQGLAAVTVRSLVVAPDLTATVYAGTPDGGVFVSLDAGDDWMGIDDGLTSGNVQAVVLDPIDTDNLHAATLGGGVFHYEFDRCNDEGGPIDCGSCQTCDPAFGCIGLPAVGCRQPVEPLKARILMKNDSTPIRDRIVWKWIKGDETLLPAYGDPTQTTNYEFCMFDESGPAIRLTMRSQIDAAGICKREKPCWKSFKERGFRFRDGQGDPDGITKLQMKIGEVGKAKIILKGKGSNLPLPELPLNVPFRVQLRNDLGECWESVYSASGTQKNDGLRYNGKAD